MFTHTRCIVGRILIILHEPRSAPRLGTPTPKVAPIHTKHQYTRALDFKAQLQLSKPVQTTPGITDLLVEVVFREWLVQRVVEPIGRTTKLRFCQGMARDCNDPALIPGAAEEAHGIDTVHLAW
eukprot:322880-Amorphochlora_amoeboformis.AAC.1